MHNDNLEERIGARAEMETLKNEIRNKESELRDMTSKMCLSDFSTTQLKAEIRRMKKGKAGLYVMARYIDAVQCAEIISDKMNIPLDDLVDVFAEIPTADVAEVKHGHWITDEKGIVICSECGEEHAWDEYRATYCEDCGAKMDGGR